MKIKTGVGGEVIGGIFTIMYSLDNQVGAQKRTFGDVVLRRHSLPLTMPVVASEEPSSNEWRG